MMDKKSNGECDHGPITTKNGHNLFSPLLTLSRRFQLLKQRQFSKYFTINTKNTESLPKVNRSNECQRKSLVKRWSSLGRTKERIEKKTNCNPQFNIIQWSSCESINGLNSKKFNSLRRSRGSLIIPVNCENSDSQLETSEVPRTSNENDCTDVIQNIDHDIVENEICCLDLNETDIVPYNEKCNQKNQCDTNVPFLYAFSLPDISENNSDDYVEISLEREVKKRRCLTETAYKVTSKDKNDNIISQSDEDIDFSLCETPKTVDANVFKKKAHSCLEYSRNHYLSTPVLINRPPVPSVPKPINRRDQALNCESKESFEAKASQVVTVTKTNNLKRTFSDFFYHKFDSFIAKDCQSNDENAVSAVKEEEKPKPMQMKDDKLWRKISSAVNVIIAEAVWDHGSLKPDELSFSSGAVISVLFTDDENWWWGIHNGAQGWFPVSYVRLRVAQEVDGDTEHFDKLYPLKEDSLSSPPLPLASNKNLEHMMRVRAKCVEELLNTEKVYVKLLQDIIQGYVLEVDGETKLFTPEDKQILFSNIEELYFFHQVFLADLQNAVNMENMEKSVVGPVFLKHKSSFEIYSTYCNNQPRSSARLSVLSKEKKINVFFEACRLRQNMIRLSLDGFLLSPVQRICKYPLQIKELIKHTAVDHPDFKQLLEAQTCMQNVASLINERKRRLENINKLAMWQLSISNWKDEDLVIKSSMLLQKGTLNKISNNKCHNYVIYLFDHQLIMLHQESQKKSALVYSRRIDLDQAKIEDLADESITINNEIVNNLFKIWCEKRQKWYTFSALNTESKLLWKSALAEERRLVNEEIEKGFDVSLEVRAAAMENAYNHYITERKRMRLKSVSTTYPTELETFRTFSYATIVEPIIYMSNTDQVVRRTNKKERSRSLRHSLQGLIFEKVA